MGRRDYRMDNAKCVLIVLVVFGHLLEGVPHPLAARLYQVIYLYHMPLFLFVTGLFAGIHTSRSIRRMLWQYFLFQTCYLIFDALVLQGLTSFTLQYTTPYWILWYLLCTILYKLMIPVVDTDRPACQAGVILLSAALSLLGGYDNTVGYYFTLSRFFTFFPFFLMGYYAQKDREAITAFFQQRRGLLRAICLTSCLVVAASVVWLRSAGLGSNVLYGSYSYSEIGYTAGTKCMMLVWAIFGGLGLLPLIPSGKIPVVSQIGKNSMSIFLLHGFVVRYLRTLGLFSHSPTGGLLPALLLTAAIVLLFGNRLAASVLDFVSLRKWIR